MEPMVKLEEGADILILKEEVKLEIEESPVEESRDQGDDNVNNSFKAVCPGTTTTCHPLGKAPCQCVRCHQWFHNKDSQTSEWHTCGLEWPL